MKKRFFAAAVALVLLLTCFAGCNKKDDTSDGETYDTAVVETKPVTYKNPFTGEDTLTKSQVSLRPVAIMINNIKVAQTVQTSVQKADMIYETEVEGGTTRLMAVYKDISRIGQVGTVRSARYAYVDLALGLDAVYVHCGRDPIYCLPHINSSGVEDFDINTGKWAAYGFREKNGLAYEHTMYTSGENITKGISELKIRNTTEKTDGFFEFADEAVTYADKADKVTVKFSDFSINNFTYDSTSGLYTKASNGTDSKDFKTGEKYLVKNIFILNTSITNYPDGYHRNVALSGGSGYYVTNGSYVPITWKKGAEKNSISYYNADGTPLKVNTGVSWINIVNDNMTPKFEAYETSAQ